MDERELIIQEVTSMHCYSLTEKVRPGILIRREDHPHVDPPEGCSTLVMLGQELARSIERYPPGVPWLCRSSVAFEEGVMVLHRARGRLPPQALVRVGTAGGVGGNVFVEAEREPTEWQGKQALANGLQALCDTPTLDAHRRGIDVLDMFVVMSPHASFRIHRTGALEGAAPQLVVRWTGSDLLVKEHWHCARQPARALLETTA